MEKPIELTGPGGRFHEAGVFVAKQILVERGWSILPTNDRWRHEGRGLIPDLIAERGDNRTRRKVRMVVEIETRRRAKEMASREAYYTDVFPPKAEKFVVIPLYQLERGAVRDSLKAIREIVQGALP